MSSAKVTVTYTGGVIDARNDDGKIWFAVEGHATLSRELRQTVAQREQVAPGPDVKASIYVVPRWSAILRDGVESADDTTFRQAEQNTQILGANFTLLLAAAQANPHFAPATALPPGMHIMCHVDSQPLREMPIEAERRAKAESTKPISVIDRLLVFWEDVKAGLGAEEQAERSRWQQPCVELLMQVAESLGSRATTSLIDTTPAKGWALVSCTPEGNVACFLARGEPVSSGMVAWYHHPMEELGEEIRESLANQVLLTDTGERQPAYAYAWAQTVEDGAVEIFAEAHRLVPDGVISGYDLHSTKPNQGQSDEPDGGIADSGVDADDVEFVEFSAFSRQEAEGWLGSVSTEELQGGGLHRHVRVKIDAKCKGQTCRGGSLVASGESIDEKNDGWCELLLSQHVPQGSYIDVDEVKARHDFDIRSLYPARQRVGIDTFEGNPIDVELPASVSGQHVVNFNVRIDAPQSADERRKEINILAELTLPVHLRYPDPGCKRRDEECNEYTWVEVSPPLASIRCGGVGGGDRLLHHVRPDVPPLPVALRVPRGIAWHRGLVVWGTIVAAALGTLFTLRTIIFVAAIDDSHRKQHEKLKKNS